MTQRTLLAAYRRSIHRILAFAALSFFFACSSSTDDGEYEEITGNSLLLNFTSDYTTGELRWMNPNFASLSAGALEFNQDSRVSVGGGKVFVLENDPGTLTCISPEEIGDESKIKQNRLDAEYPYEAAVIGGKGYIAYGNDENYVQVFDINTCVTNEKIELPAANAASIKASSDTLLVVLQRLDGYTATKPGLLVRINATAKTVIDTIQLNFYNPHSSVLSNGKLLVASNNYGFDEGIEIVDLATKASAVLVTGTELGGGAYDIALDEENQILYAVVYEDWGILPVKAVTLSGKTVGTSLPNITDASGGIVFDEVAKKLFAGDNPGLKIYDPASKTTTAVNEGANALPPSSLAIVRW